MSLKDFKNCDVKYAYDKNNQIYSIKIMLEGKPAIVTIRAGKDLMDITVTNEQGKVVEYVGQKGKQLEYTRNEILAADMISAFKSNKN